MLRERVSGIFVLLLGVPGLALLVLGGVIHFFGRAISEDEEEDDRPRKMLRMGTTLLATAVAIVLIDLILLPQAQ